MNYINFSMSYYVRMLTDRDIPLILALCEKNAQFYEHCPPFVTAESIRDDMRALPQRKMDEMNGSYPSEFERSLSCTLPRRHRSIDARIRVRICNILRQNDL